ncbi:MAG: PD40 domain-containing protein [Acidobacteria bacterium]|nr:PD40 domain-containing protein [Acidobacteriota bacterium]
MNKPCFILLFSIFAMILFSNNFGNIYLIQDPPAGENPELFSKGFISDDNQQHSSLAFSPDCKEIWWSEWHLPYDNDRFPQDIQYTTFENGKWNETRVAPFSGKYRDGGPAFSSDGNRIFFYSRRPHEKPDGPMEDNDIWYVERTENGWGKPVRLDEYVNSPDVDVQPTLAANDNLYFVSNRDIYNNPVGNTDIYLSRFENGKYTPAKNLGAPINTADARESVNVISPDESYIIFARDNRIIENGEVVSGMRKLMISFNIDNGKWSEPQDMGEEFYSVRFASVTPDGKYLFFTKYTSGNDEDYYWVKADIIQKLKAITFNTKNGEK